MSLGDNITRIHRPAKYKPTVYVAWAEDLWQQGDPMFYSIKDRSQIRAEPKQQPPFKPIAECSATAEENRTGVKVQAAPAQPSAPPPYF
jgi:hypothetical protein